jgi:nitrite reductase/ring-hydroxylating ferredoxin subunit
MSARTIPQAAEQRIGTVHDVPDGGRSVFLLGELEIGVYRRGDRWFAYENRCVHQGGPACEGITISQVEPVFDADRGVVGERFGDEEHIVCPWHGYEYRLEDGRVVGDERRRLRSFEVRRRGEDLYVVV